GAAAGGAVEGVGTHAGDDRVVATAGLYGIAEIIGDDRVISVACPNIFYDCTRSNLQGPPRNGVEGARMEIKIRAGSDRGGINRRGAARIVEHSAARAGGSSELVGVDVAGRGCRRVT